MRAILVMFDSLNRHFLPNYGCDWTKLPNFERLGRRTATFDRFYGGSMPCMPARRELHTGRYNFLHRSWSPMEPYDESVFCNLRAAGVYSHISTDHFHYWEDGGSCYLTKYDSFDMERGQQGDPWKPCVEKPDWPETLSTRTAGGNWRHDWANRAELKQEAQMPQVRTFENGLRFLEKNADTDQWLLQIESFDPHEPFYSLAEYHALYPHSYRGANMDWPNYGRNDLPRDATEHLRLEYAALMSMCDRSLGKVLDFMDAHDMWKDTLLIVHTDHGFMLGEKEWMGKNLQPFYNELIHLPFFIHDPRCPAADGTRRTALAQTIDIPVTLAEYFNAKPLRHAEGVSLLPAVEKEQPVRNAALFGIFGGHINVTDGRWVYMRAAAQCDNAPLYEYTLMPCHMNGPFKPAELAGSELAPGFSFTQGCPVLRIEAKGNSNSYWHGTMLFDLEQDPAQAHPSKDAEQTRRMAELLRAEMHRSEAPAEQYARVGLPAEGEISARALQSGPPVYQAPKAGSLTFTPRCEKALAIYLAMRVAAQQQAFLKGLTETFAPDTRLGEDQLFACIRAVEDPRFCETTIKTIRDFL